MPKLANYNDCTGCMACHHICSQKCIEIVEDAVGVVHPIVVDSKCVGCNACERVCPAINPNELSFPQKAYAAWNTDDNERRNSASGGIAAAIYSLVSKVNGFSIGAAIEDDWSVWILPLESSNISKFKNSKYSYSNPSKIYGSIKEAIKANRMVVLIGLPCQIAGFRKTFGNHDNLFYVDLVCHGVAPNSYLRQHINHLATLIGLPIGSMSFRAPEKGTANYYFTLYNKEGEIVYSKRSADGDVYNLAFHRSYSYRENCYHCHYSRPERVSDMTLGDYHGLGKESPCDFSEEEVSVILVNTGKGDQLLNRLVDNGLITVVSRPLLEPIHGDNQLQHPMPKPNERIDFERYIGKFNGDFCNAMTKVLKLKNRREVWMRLRSLLRRIVRKGKSFFVR